MTPLTFDQKDLVLAVDIGTSGCRAALFNDQGEVLRSVEAFYSYSCAGGSGFAEQDPEEILGAFIDVVERAGAGCDDAIATVVVDSVLHSLVLVGDDGVPLTPLSIWADTRATDQCASLRLQFQRQQWHRKTGCPLAPTYPLARLLWYRDRQPDLFGRFAKALSVKSFIFHRLFGLCVEDYALASASGLFNLKTHSWDGDILAALGMPIERLPEPVPVEYRLPVPAVGPRTAARLPWGAAWVVGGGDGPMAHLGSAGYRSSIASLTLGTSCAVRLPASVDSAGNDPAVWTYLLDRDRFISGIASNNGGNVVDWYLSLFRLTADWPTLDVLLRECPFDGSLLFFPYLFAERHLEDGASPPSGFLGVGPGHPAIQLMRAVVEGVVFHAVHLVDRLAGGRPLEGVALSGSLTDLTLVREIVAELMGVPVLAAPDRLAPLRGSVVSLGTRGALPSLPMTRPRGGYGQKYADWLDHLGARRGKPRREGLRA
ncbi:gluconokinase [Geomesophilobacter sediminis]|uniref:Carbohydrate kinase n=1 Tax=Geomesophilobacter sediminis TaxID=2798584 RepID=A0A8J7IM40_9BACT|nr:FGGY family carbohydrate kinase [Geomesophilobacter sediminis]MBJ6723678.1 hypothetical protein [Geomesophilobacter sediminis]